MSDAPLLDLSKAPSPIPKPGILDIAPYVPGKAKVEGVEHPLKLSANENILGTSPKAREAFATAAVQFAGAVGESHADTLRSREAIARVEAALSTKKHN